MKLTMGEVAAFLGSMSGAPECLVTGYSIDSRTIAPGQLFFALRGPRFDGHEFVAPVLEAGAAGAVVETSFAVTASAAWRPALIPVADPRDALQILGQAVRRRWGKRLIAVTGSTGKSTTKEMIAAVLGQRFRVLRSPGNLNNDYGLPLALLALEPEHHMAVMELGMSAAGEIARLSRLAEPDAGVVTNVAPVHLEFFDSVDAIARAKRELIDYLATRGENSVAILNADDERVRRFAEGFPGQVLTYGIAVTATFRANDVRPAEKGSAFRVVAPEWVADFTLPVPGRHNIENAMAAITTASFCGLAPSEIQKGLARFENLHRRSEILTLSNGVTVIDDCYNSNPLAMERMLEVLAEWPGARRRIVVAGEMLELGPGSPELHRAVGRECAQHGVVGVVAVQGDAKFFLEGAAEGGIPLLHFFPDAKQAGEFCRRFLLPGDVVLVKGSRGVHLERAIEMLKEQEPGASSQESEGALP